MRLDAKKCGMAAFDVPRTPQTAALPCQILPLTEAPANDLWSFVNSIGIIEWSQSNRAYIMTHGVSGIDWKHYKHPLPENIYSTYMRYWGDVELEVDASLVIAQVTKAEVQAVQEHAQARL